MTGQMTIFDVPDIIQFDRVKSYCKHFAAILSFDENGHYAHGPNCTTHDACSFKNEKTAKCWDDWQICCEENCPFLHPSKD